MKNIIPNKLEQKLQQLSLTSMPRHIEQAFALAAEKHWSPAVTLEWLADIELGARQDRAIERRFHSARLNARQTIDAFQFSHHKSRQQVANQRPGRKLDKGTSYTHYTPAVPNDAE